MATEMSQSGANDPGLSYKWYAVFATAFFLIPAVNVLVSSVLYYVWKRNNPRAAKQINNLGFIVLGLQVLLYFLIATVLAGLPAGGSQQTL